MIEISIVTETLMVDVHIINPKISEANCEELPPSPPLGEMSGNMRIVRESERGSAAMELCLSMSDSPYLGG